MIKALTSGIFSSFQDQGRTGYRKWGVPIGGVMDSYHANLANHLVQNYINTTVLEMTFTGPLLTFMVDATIAITGAGFKPMINQKSIPMNTSVVIRSGQTLRIGSPTYGRYGYLAIAGGLELERILGSRSYHPTICPNALIKKGDEIFLKKRGIIHSSNNAVVRQNEAFFNELRIGTTLGPEFNLLPKKEQAYLLTNPFSLAPESNRMGYRLATTQHLTAPEIITSSVQPGTVQLTPSGQLIILMRDGPTTGGYARVLQLTTKGINCLAQKREGDLIQFNEVG